MINMSNIEEARRKFYAAREGLKAVHTREALELQLSEAESLRNHLLEIDPEFRAMIERRLKLGTGEMRVEYKAQTAKARRIASQARTRAEVARRGVDDRV